ncbi:MAG TPA: FAD/NAD(P)-binding protein [Terriglobales bacterium]|nr:FAD/NAD(P)-binding protein [Terriglobales bacterium]
MGQDEHNVARDPELGMDRAITRRDFLNGVAVTIGASLLPAGLPALAADAGPDDSSQEPLLAAGITPEDPRYYPPALTGMRGSHPGSFESAHLVRDGNWKASATNMGESYDLVVVGGGISGLAAAYFYRKAAGDRARILIVDNHDDFGGHAKRNEFRPGGRLLLGNGGTFAIESPFPYSAVARGLMDELGIHPPALEAKHALRHLYDGLESAVFFNKETFGADRLVSGEPTRAWMEATPKSLPWKEFLDKCPVAPEVRRDILKIETDSTDYMPGVPEAEKRDRLSRMSYKDFLLKVVKANAGVIPFYQKRTHDLYGVGIDAVPALDCWALYFPGFQGMKLRRVPEGRLSFTARGAATPNQDSYHFHYPDGNATIARLLVRSLVPGSVPGHDAEDVVTAKVDYSRLDREGSPVRIRLNSTAVEVRHAGGADSAKEVEVTYALQGKAYKVRGKGVVLACWNMMIPYLCEDMPEKQKKALRYGSKVPLVYTTAAIRNWSAFQKLGVQRVFCPGMYHSSLSLDYPTSLGGYKFPTSPEEPMLVRMTRTPCSPGMSARAQQMAGRYDLFATPFSTFERNIRDQLGRVLGGGGFDPARDIQAITVNRWPHGYAYEYNPLWDPDWPAGQSPCEVGRQKFGRITIANSDAAAAAYTDKAVDEAYRAVTELLGKASVRTSAS